MAVTIAEARAPMGLHKKVHLRAMLSMPEVREKWRVAQRGDWTETHWNTLFPVTPMQVAAAKVHSKLIPETLDGVEELRGMGEECGHDGVFS